MNGFYNWLTKIGTLNFEKKSVLIVGGGYIARAHANACLKFKINDITMVSNSGIKEKTFCQQNNITSLTGGIEKNLEDFDKKDLVIVCTPISKLIDTTRKIIHSGQNNILVEKPGALDYESLLSLQNDLTTQRVKIAYNRLVFPSFHKLIELATNDGGISSCTFSLTEIVDRINFKKDISEVYERWGISNSSHVISMVADLIGLPKEISSKQHGKLDWHHSGSIFVGSGISEQNIPFSYSADWNGGGRWGIEIATKKNLYRLRPLEKLFSCIRGSFDWNEVPLQPAFSDVKEGLAEQIAIMLSEKIDNKIDLTSLTKASKFNQFTEKIFNYNIND